MNLTKSSVLVLILNVASVFTYNRTIINSASRFNKQYVNAVASTVELIYSFDLPDNFDPLVNLILK